MHRRVELRKPHGQTMVIAGDGVCNKIAESLEKVGRGCGSNRSVTIMMSPESSVDTLAKRANRDTEPGMFDRDGPWNSWWKRCKIEVGMVRVKSQDAV